MVLCGAWQVYGKLCGISYMGKSGKSSRNCGNWLTFPPTYFVFPIHPFQRWQPTLLSVLLLSLVIISHAYPGITSKTGVQRMWESSWLDKIFHGQQLRPLLTCSMLLVCIWVAMAYYRSILARALATLDQGHGRFTVVQPRVWNWISMLMLTHNYADAMYPHQYN
jgi:hypothetical protein